MSCILVGLGTINLKASQMTSLQLFYLSLRDLLLLGGHSFLLYKALSYTDNDKVCVESSSIYPWLYFDLFVNLLRLIKNPLQYFANRTVENNGSGWSNPNELPYWVRWVEGRHLCQMKIYTIVDWLSYLTWIVGAWAVRPADNCGSNLVSNVAYWEISFSTIFYVCTILLYIFIFMVYRISSGRLFPGFAIKNNSWPESCPSIGFDRSQWKRRDETYQEYRHRVVEAFERNERLVTIEPAAIRPMATRRRRLTQAEIDSLPIIVYKSREERLGAMESQETLGERISIDSKSSNLKNDSDRDGNTDDIEMSNLKISTLSLKPTIVIMTPLDHDHEQDKTTDETCALCLEDYQPGEKMRELFCKHRYHVECIDEWLSGKRRCPVCNADAIGEKDGQEEEVDHGVDEVTVNIDDVVFVDEGGNVVQTGSNLERELAGEPEVNVNSPEEMDVTPPTTRV